MSLSETYFFSLTIVSPVHVGCGEVYEPMNFVVDEQTLELVNFDPADFMERLTDEELNKLSAICMKGTVASLQELYKFMKRHSHVASGVRIGVSGALAQHYQEVLEKDSRRFCRELNQFEINRTYYNPVENVPVIPGSAIKGAIRTAVLNLRNNGMSTPSYRGRNAAREMEEKLLQYSFRDMSSDPFRLIKVSDFVPAGNARRRICYAVDMKKRPSERDASALYQMQEVVEPGAIFWGSITVSPPHRSIRQPVTMNEIISALKGFYGSEKDREEKELRPISVKPPSMNDDDIPIRIGRHSGAECVTVKGHRNIKIMQGRGNKPRYLDHATTVWLAADRPRPRTMQGLSPMGWVAVKSLSDEEVKKFRTDRQNERKEHIERIQQEMKEAARLKARRLEQIKKEEEARRKAEQEEAREKERIQALKEKWSSLSELEQDLAIIRGDELARINVPGKNAFKDVWPKLESADDEYKEAVASAFRELWENDPQKWRKKQCTKGQWDKVQTVVSILGLDHPDMKKLSEDDQKLLDKINSLNDWGAFKQSGIKMEELSLAAAQCLKTKFKQWGCAERRANKTKKNALKQLQKRIKDIQKL